MIKQPFNHFYSMLSDPAIKKLQHKVQRKADVFPAVFRALGDRTRFLMFSLLVDQKELCVTDIARIFRLLSIIK